MSDAPARREIDVPGGEAASLYQEHDYWNSPRCYRKKHWRGPRGIERLYEVDVDYDIQIRADAPPGR